MTGKAHQCPDVTCCRFVHAGQRGAYCLGVFDNAQQGTLLGGITFRNVLVQVQVLELC